MVGVASTFDFGMTVVANKIFFDANKMFRHKVIVVGELAVDKY